MSKLKVLGVLGGIVAIVALSATPASALFKGKQSQGKVTVINSGEFKYAGQGTVKCPASEIKAQYIIQGAGQIKQQLKVTTEGPHLNLQVKDWGPNCVAEIGTTKFLAGEVEVKECILQATDQAGLVAVGGVVTPCTIKLGLGTANLCVVQVPAGMEDSQGSGKGINVGLSKITLENKVNNLFGIVNAESGGTGQLPGEAIYAASVGSNALCTLKKVTEEAVLKGVEGELEGVNA